MQVVYSMVKLISDRVELQPEGVTHDGIHDASNDSSSAKSWPSEGGYSIDEDEDDEF